MNILHVASDFPYPPHHGARVDIWGRICALAELGHNLHLIATVRSTPRPEYINMVMRKVSRLDIVQRASAVRGILTNCPLQVVTRQELRTVPLWQQYDLALIEQEFTSAILENQHLQARRLVLRVHNDESKFFSDLRKSSQNVISKAYYAMEELRFRRWSPRIFARVDELWFISYDNCHGWMERHPAEAYKAKWLPPPIAQEPWPCHASDRAQVLFVGNLVAPTNIEGIEWYLTEVHSALRDVAGYQFVVAGSLLGGTLPSFLRRAQDNGDCSLILNADDLTTLYQNSTVFVNPMQRGASLKLKTINAAERGLPVVTTSVGNEGTGFKNGRHVLIADTPSDFARSIRSLLEDPQSRNVLASESQEFLRVHYNHIQHLGKLLSPMNQNVS